MAGDAVDILYEGTKYFVNTRTLFHIALVEHTNHDIIEVVSYDKRYSEHAPSLFLIYSVLLQRIDNNTVRQRILELREEAYQCDLMADEIKINKNAVGEAIFAFLVNHRLFASAIGVNRAKLEFRLLLKDLNSTYDRNPLCSKPGALVPFSSASVLISEGRGLSSKEKWNTPVMLTKVAKIKSLRNLSRGNSKVSEEEGSIFVDNDAETIGSALFSSITMTNSGAVSTGEFSASSKSQRWTLSQRPLLATMECNNPVPEEGAALLYQLKARRMSSFSAGYDVILSSLQRGAEMIQNTSMKSSAVASGSTECGARGSFRAGSMKLYATAGFSSADSVGSFDIEGSRKFSSRKGSSNPGTAMNSMTLSGRMAEPFSEAGASAKESAELKIVPPAVLSPCERANQELRAARSMAKQAADAAHAAQTASTFRVDLYVDTAAGTRVNTPRNDAPSSPRKDVLSSPSSPSVRLQLAAQSVKNGVTGLLNPVMRMLGTATRRSSSAAVAAED